MVRQLVVGRWARRSAEGCPPAVTDRRVVLLEAVRRPEVMLGIGRSIAAQRQIEQTLLIV
jgi:hypothetical protein